MARNRYISFVLLHNSQVLITDFPCPFLKTSFDTCIIITIIVIVIIIYYYYYYCYCCCCCCFIELSIETVHTLALLKFTVESIPLIRGSYFKSRVTR